MARQAAKKIGAVGARARRRQRDSGQAEDGADEAPALQEVAQRHDQGEPEDIADLDQRHDQAGRLQRQAEAGADQADERLGIVEIGGDESAGGGQRHRQRCRYRLGQDETSRRGCAVSSPAKG